MVLVYPMWSRVIYETPFVDHTLRILIQLNWVIIAYNDFMAYDIFAGWSIHGRLTCSICGSDTDCFHLTVGGKVSYFDCHLHWLPKKHPFRM
jgi:hypothetical protein